MAERLCYLCRVFLFFTLSFIVQKPLFMVYNRNVVASTLDVTAADYLAVIVHGLRLDATTAAYLIIIPFLAVCCSFFCKSFPIKKIIVPYYICVTTIISFIFIADTVVYPFWGFKLNSSALIYADTPTAITANVSYGFTVLCILAILLLSTLYICLLYMLTPPFFHTFRSNKAWSSAMLPIGMLIFLLLRGGIEESTSNISRVYYSHIQYFNHSAINPVFNIFYSLTKTKDFSNEFHYFNKAEKESLVKGVFTTESVGNENLLTCPRPNILLIIWEGCGGHFVEATGGDKNVTPNLNNIAKESVVFTNCYAGSFRTDRGTVCILNGWLGFPTTSIMKTTEKSRSLPSLATSLGKEGYSTDFWYGGDVGFTNMKSYLYESGYKKISSGNDFPKKYRNYSKWGVPDHILLDSLATNILNRRNNSRWFTTVLTLSSHEPWDVPCHRISDEKKNSFAYTDLCIGKLIKRLRTTSVWKNLLIIIIPDHGIKEYDEQEGSDYRIAHIPMVWTGGAVSEKFTTDKLMCQSDMAATLLGQLQISHKQFIFSRDIFSRTYNYPSAFHTFINGMTFIDSTGVSTFDNTAQKTIFTKDNGTATDGSLRTRRAKAILQELYEDMSRR